jgi:ROK family protein
MTATGAAVPFGIDFGGTGIKGAPVDLEKGDFAAERVRIDTPHPSTPTAVAEVFVQLLSSFPDSEGAVGVTVPAIVRHGVVHSAANIDQHWIGEDADKLFTDATGRDVHVVNDADAAGLAEVRYGAAKGRGGLVLVTTLGTGLGAGLRRCPRPQLRARPHRDRRSRRRVARRLECSRARGPLVGALGEAADGVLPQARAALLPRPVRRRRWCEQEGRQVPAPHRHRDRDRARPAAQRGRHRRRCALRHREQRLTPVSPPQPVPARCRRPARRARSGARSGRAPTRHGRPGTW